MKRGTSFTQHIALAIGLVAGAGPAMAIGIDITVPDNAGSPTNFFNSPTYVSPNNAKEDNETERTSGLLATANQSWDMEAFALNGYNLSIVAGYDLINGNEGWKPGDLFIKIGGTDPLWGSTSAPGQTQNNIFPSGQGYSYAVSLSRLTAADTSAFVYKLDTNSMLWSVNWDGFLSNPWKYASGAINTSSTAISYTSGQYASQVATVTGVAGLSALKGDLTGPLSTASASHNILGVNLGFLAGQVPVGTPVWFSYVMECGNDSLKGSFDGGFTRVPDSGASIALIGLGLASLLFLGNRRRV